MISDGTLEVFECAIAIDKHFLNKPIALACGHHICKECIPTKIENQNQSIKCNICNTITVKDLSNDNESKLFQSAFQFKINELFGVVEASFKRSLTEYKGLISFLNISSKYEVFNSK